MIKKILPFSAILMFLNSSFAQTAPGEWTEHISYHIAEKVVVDDNNKKIYVATKNSLFSYSKSDGDLRGITKVQGLSEVNIATIAYAPLKDLLIIAYDNQSIDILDKKNKIVNLPYIKNKLTISDRRINDILVLGNTAYLSCNFGIVVLDLDKLQIKDTYYPGPGGSINRVNHLCTNDRKDSIFAATQTGIYKALISDPYLVDYSRWNHLSGFSANNKECKSVEYLGGNLFAVYSNSADISKDSLLYFNGNSWNMAPHFGNGNWINSINVSGNKLYCSTGWGEFTFDKNLIFNVMLIGDHISYATTDNEGNSWLSDKIKTLIKISQNGTADTIKPPDSPFYPDVVKMDFYDGSIWTVAGSKDEGWSPLYNNKGAEGYFSGKWNWYNSDITKELNNVRDIVNVRISTNPSNKIYLASWQNGLIEYNTNNNSFKIFNSGNSSLQGWNAYGTVVWYQIYGMSFDLSENLWVTNSNVKKQLSVLTPKGTWKNFSLGNTAIANGYIGDVLVTSWDHKWIVLGKSTNLVVYDSGNKPLDESDDRKVDISLANVQSIIQPTKIFCIAEDHQGSIWIGTDAGPVRFDSPQNAFDEGGITGAKIKVLITKGKNDAAYLLENERINTIAIDGADRKWFGTQNSGAYLMSNDGLKQISHFTSENSQLFSNTINDIKIDPKSGEVYFATDKGLVSYKGDATKGGDEFGKVYVYPNPIRENYTGNIFVTGLIENTIVKITDISGNLVFETKSLGGQAVWNGKNLLGNRVNTGVYLVFCSNKDGSKTAVTKLLFIH